MVDAVKDNVSNATFIFLTFAFILIVSGVVVLAAFIAPNAWSAVTVEATRCSTSASEINDWHWQQGYNKCDILIQPLFYSEHEEHMYYFKLARNTVFTAEVPQSEGQESVSVGLSRYQRRLIGVMRLHLFEEDPREVMEFEASLGYADQDNPETIHKIETQNQMRRTLCHMVTKNYFQGESYDCAPTVLFTLYSLHHDHYILNIKPKPDDKSLGYIRKMSVSFISDNGDYIKFLWSLKAIFFVVVLISFLKFLWILTGVIHDGPDTDGALICASFFLLFMTCPWDFLMVTYDIPGFVIFSIVRDNLFYASLLTLFTTVTAECLGPFRAENPLSHLVRVGFFLLIIGDSAVHYFYVTSPVPKKWDSSHFSITITILFLLALYFIPFTIRIFLALLVVRDRKQETREERSSGETTQRWRQVVVLVISWITVALTLTEFTIKRLHDGMCFWEDIVGNLEIMNTGPLLLGVFCLWNMYFLWMLLLYLPCYAPQDFLEIAMEENAM